ncbi:MAG: ABC transporter permease [Opitutae bacterium]|nr:ABC transporter permease [Opitutae bacterium]
MPNFMKSSLTRISWMTRLTFLEAIRQRFFAFLILLSAALVLSSVSFRFLDFGHGELKFVCDFGFGGMFLFGSVLAVVMSAQLFFAEMDNRTALTLLAKPVSRTEFLVGKFIGVWLVLGVFIFTLSTLLAIILWARCQELTAAAIEVGKAPPELSITGLFSYTGMQWARLGVVAAMILMVASLARTFLFTVIVGAMLVVAGQLQWLAQETLLKPGDLNFFSKALLSISTYIIPNLQQFNIGDALTLDHGSVADGAVTLALFSGTCYIVVFIFIGSLII